MRLIIDIPDYNLDEVENGSIAAKMILNAIKNGIRISEPNSSNGLVAKTVFPELDVRYDLTVHRFIDDVHDVNFSVEWWDSTYRS